MFTLNCKGRLRTFDSPIVMGIINATPDSFYTGSRELTAGGALEKARRMIDDGASILDIGGQSTRPGSKMISESEETERILPIIDTIAKNFPDILISVDTFYSSVAEKAILLGASLVNDVTGGEMDGKMLSTVGRLKVPFVCMHMKGTPESMQNKTTYQNVTLEVLDYFIERTSKCLKAGIHDLIIDPGFGFAKNITQNLELLRRLSILKILSKPLLVGLSRKSTVYKTLAVSPDGALNGTTVLNTVALINGADILRVHDVKETVEAIKLISTYRQQL